MHLTSTRRAAAALILFCVTPALPAEVAPPTAGYQHYLIGNAADVVRPTTGLLVLQGGGDDVDENYIRMGAHGGGGDFVVLRASGDDDYNDYIYGLCHCDSVETIVFYDREAASDPYVIHTIRKYRFKGNTLAGTSEQQVRRLRGKDVGDVFR